MDPAFDTTISLGNYELTAYVFALDLAARRFSKRAHDIDLIMSRYQALRNYTTPAVKVLVHAPLQYAMKLLEKPTSDEPWRLEGRLLSKVDIDNVSGLDMHVGLSGLFALRLKVLFDAPMAEQRKRVDDGWAVSPSMANLVIGSEWAFLSALVLLQTDPEDKRLAQCIEYLEYTSIKCESSSDLNEEEGKARY